MDVTTVLLIFSLFLVKHFIADFLVQFPYMYKNKGIYGHPGGVDHAYVHGMFTMGIIAFFFSFPISSVAALIDVVLHYHVDWAKIQLTTRFKLDANKHEAFWYLLGLDQLLHMLTYIGILYICFK